MIFRFKGNGNERIVDNCPQWHAPCGILCSYPQSPAGTSGLVPAGIVFKAPLKTMPATEHFPGVPIPTLEGEFEGACPLMRVREVWGMDSHTHIKHDSRGGLEGCSPSISAQPNRQGRGAATDDAQQSRPLGGLRRRGAGVSPATPFALAKG